MYVHNYIIFILSYKQLFYTSGFLLFAGKTNTYDQMMELENTENSNCIHGYKNIIFQIRDNYLLCEYKF